ncbi:unnamed protein product [Caenorhabditis auriculariae]|uniref:Uncharacterized protein n=1 Tax=Caenorhabditis auriculariae TaxID=2777116 RepID=A0A8S1GNQ8_9PELO|nr:unnamed protein product [Caenorhabditis auriculariae]
MEIMSSVKHGEARTRRGCRNVSSASLPSAGPADRCTRDEGLPDSASPLRECVRDGGCWLTLFRLVRRKRKCEGRSMSKCRESYNTRHKEEIEVTTTGQETKNEKNEE